jgi:hypothetical protein
MACKKTEDIFSYADFIYTVVDKDTGLPLIGKHDGALFHPDSFSFVIEMESPYEITVQNYPDSTADIRFFFSRTCGADIKKIELQYSNIIFDQLILLKTKQRRRYRCAGGFASSFNLDFSVNFRALPTSTCEPLDTMRILY